MQHTLPLSGLDQGNSRLPYRDSTSLWLNIDASIPLMFYFATIL
jgi:hypothetical protein